MARGIGHNSVSAFDLVLTSGANAVQGELAVGDPATGKVKPGAVGTNLRPLGFFTESMTGDGTSTVNVQLFGEKEAYLMANDATNAVGFAFQTCYVASGSSVSTLATGTSVAGAASTAAAPCALSQSAVSSVSCPSSVKMAARDHVPAAVSIPSRK